MPTKKSTGAKRPGKKRARKAAPARVPRTQRAKLSALLKQFEEQLAEKETRITVAEYLRLLQMERELETDKVRDVKVTWVDQNASEE